MRSPVSAFFRRSQKGKNIEAAGDYTDHPTYGTQFKVVSFEEKAPEDQEAIERYLGSGAIKGNRACNGSPYCAEV